MGRRISVISALKVADLLIMVGWFGVAVFLTSTQSDQVSVASFLSLRFSLGNILLFGSFVFLWHFCLASAQVYAPLAAYSSLRETISIARGSLAGTLALLVLTVLFSVSFVSTVFLFVFWLGVVALSVAARLLTQLFRRSVGRLQPGLRRLLVVGLNPRSIRLARGLEAEADLGYQLLGFADDASMAPYPLVATTDALPDYLRETAVDEVLVCLPLKSHYEAISDIVSVCEEQGIMVRVLADLFQPTLARSYIEQFGNQSLITVRPHGIVGPQAFVKRMLDVILSTILIIVLLPIFAISVLSIKLTSRGPILFAQQRLGLNKKRFKILKFRTMVAGAEQQQAALEHLNEVDGPVFKINDDPRITPIGRLLRRTSFDELPQLFNVVSGQMSLVGPRPLPIRDYEGFSEDWHRRRFSVRPGISGLWQINGRSSLSFERWMELDLEYIEEWSLLLDLKLMLKTVPAVLRGTGAA